MYENITDLFLEGELWKQIEKFPDYEVSNLGRVKSFKQNKIDGKILKQKIDKDGYLGIGLFSNNKKIYYMVHRLILETFNKIENMNKLQVNHINGIKTDNRLENLEFCTCSENNKHAFKIGLKNQRCENHNLSKLNNKQVEFIKMIFETLEFRSKKITIRYIANEFNVSISTISSIKNNRLWLDIKINNDSKLIYKLNNFLNNLGNSYLYQNGEKNPRCKLKEWKVKSIYQISNSPITKQLKITQKEIGEIFGVSQMTISKIKLRKIWSHVGTN